MGPRRTKPASRQAAQGAHPTRQRRARGTPREPHIPPAPSIWTPRRIALLALLIFPLGLIVLLFRQPAAEDAWLEIVFLVIGVPIVVINMWEWGFLRAGEGPDPDQKRK